MCASGKLISVIIPVYNGEKYIGAAVSSVLKQPFQGIEIILVNDGSKDGSGKICKSFAKRFQNIKYFEQENSGIGATRNFGIKNAEGRYLAFLDQDDVWVNNFLNEKTVKNIENGGDIIGFSCYFCNETLTRGRFIAPITGQTFGGGYEAVQSSWNHHSSFFFLREMIIGNDITYPLTRCEDEIFRHKCLYVSNKITYLEEPMFLYRNNSASETHRRQPVEFLYGPLLDSWNDLVMWHRTFHPEDQRIIRLCENMMCIYSIEAIEQMYQSGMGEKKVFAVIREDLKEELLRKYQSVVLNNKNGRRIDCFYNHHLKFVLMNRGKGLLRKTVKIFLRIPFFRKIFDIKRYPAVISEEIYCHETY